MTIDQITLFIEENCKDELPVTIHLKNRGSFTGLFVLGTDYGDLRSKNFWRIVREANINNYLRRRDVSFTKIYSGVEFTSLAKL